MENQSPPGKLVMSADRMQVCTALGACSAKASRVNSQKQVLQSSGLGASALCTTGPVVISPALTSRSFLSFTKPSLPPINEGAYYYEVTLYSEGHTQIGWATKNCGLTEHEGLGDKYALNIALLLHACTLTSLSHADMDGDMMAVVDRCGIKGEERCPKIQSGRQEM